MDRKSDFQQTLWDLQRKLGQRALVPLSTLAERDRIPTGFAQMDDLLGGHGVSAGQVTAIIGMPSSGVTSLSYSLLAQAQKQERSVFMVDLGNTFDPWTAMQWGVVPERIGTLHANEVQDSLEVIRILIREVPKSLLLLDATDPQRSPTLVTHLPKLVGKVHGELVKNNGAVLVLLPRLPGKDVQTLFDTILRLERQRWLMRDDDIEGYHTQVTLLKDSAIHDPRTTFVDIWLKGEPL